MGRLGQRLQSAPPTQGGERWNSPKATPQYAVRPYAPLFNSARCSGKQRAQNHLWQSAAGSSSAKEANEPANAQPHAADQPKAAPDRPLCESRCHLPLGLAKNLQALIGSAATSSARIASESASTMTSGTTAAEGKDEEEDARVVDDGGNDEELEAGARERWRTTSSKVIVRAALAAHVAASSRGTSRMYPRTAEDPQRPRSWMAQTSTPAFANP